MKILQFYVLIALCLPLTLVAQSSFEGIITLSLEGKSQMTDNLVPGQGHSGALEGSVPRPDEKTALKFYLKNQQCVLEITDSKGKLTKIHSKEGSNQITVFQDGKAIKMDIKDSPFFSASQYKEATASLKVTKMNQIKILSGKPATLYKAEQSNETADIWVAESFQPNLGNWAFLPVFDFGLLTNGQHVGFILSIEGIDEPSGKSYRLTNTVKKQELSEALFNITQDAEEVIDMSDRMKVMQKMQEEMKAAGNNPDKIREVMEKYQKLLNN